MGTSKEGKEGMEERALRDLETIFAQVENPRMAWTEFAMLAGNCQRRCNSEPIEAKKMAISFLS